MLKLAPQVRGKQKKRDGGQECRWQLRQTSVFNNADGELSEKKRQGAEWVVMCSHVAKGTIEKNKYNPDSPILYIHAFER